MTMAQEVRTYYDEVKRHLSCPEAEQHRLLTEANRLLLDLQADAPTLDRDAVVDFFGEPETFAAFLMEQADPAALESHAQVQKWDRIWKRVAAACLVAMAVCWIGGKVGHAYGIEFFPASQQEPALSFSLQDDVKSVSTTCEVLEDGLTARSSMIEYHREQSAQKKAAGVRTIRYKGETIAAIELSAVFRHNGKQVTVEESSVEESTVFGWNYVPGEVVTSARDSGFGSVELTGELRPLEGGEGIPVNIMLHCSPTGQLS